MRRPVLIGGAAIAALIGTPCFAADMPLKALSSPQWPVSASWSGFYLGVEGGGAFGDTNQIAGGPLGFGAVTPGYKVTGGLAGGLIGYNWQVQNWVLGLEGDMSWTNVRGNANEQPPFMTSTVVDTKENWLATGRARLGWTTSNNIMFYATGGVATASVQADIIPAGVAVLTDTQKRWGGVFGGGIESKIAPHWSVKAEYLYVKFQTTSYFSNPPPGTNTRSDVPIDDNIFRFGIDYALQ